MYQMLIMSAAFSLMLPFGFVVPTWTDAGWLLLNGVGNGLAQYWWTRAIHLAPTSVVSPFQYFSLIWAMMLGFAIWGDVPTVSLHDRRRDRRRLRPVPAVAGVRGKPRERFRDKQRRCYFSL